MEAEGYGGRKSGMDCFVPSQGAINFYDEILRCLIYVCSLCIANLYKSVFML